MPLVHRHDLADGEPHPLRLERVGSQELVC
jgi:hypothetical protein